MRADERHRRGGDGEFGGAGGADRETAAIRVSVRMILGGVLMVLVRAGSFGGRGRRSVRLPRCQFLP